MAMSSYADIDDECLECTGTCEFKKESLPGHSKPHRTSTCKDCKAWTLLEDCIGC